MTKALTRPKTVRFDESTFKRIVIAASMFNVTTSEYIRALTINSVSRIDLNQMLREEES